VRYPRGVGPGVVADESLDSLEIGKAIVRYSPDECEHKLVILAFGSMCEPSLEAGRALGATVVDMRWVKPIDADLLQRFAEQRYSFVTVEEGCIMGGAGSAVTEHLHAQGFNNAVLQLGLPDEFIDHGDPVLLLKNLGLDAQGIQTSIKQHYGELFDRHTNVVRHVAGRAANT
jgi:1-deoxy-D-xylulose-5-phosphate synthase